jgi:hypothetical protein
MTELAPTAKQTEIRLAMLKNGYTPLGSECKAVKIKNWSHLDVTEKLIERWKRREDLMTSGVRVDAPLVVMDFDIDDAATIDKVFAAIEAKDAVLGAALAAAPCRFGGGDKLALFLRSEDGVRGTWHSKAYYRPWDVESDESKAKLQRLEVFGAGNDGEDARYMATNGAHTLGPDGEVAREYIWEDGRDLTRVPVGDLPVITKAQVLLAVDTASEVLHDAGWVYEVSSKAGKSASVIEYALVPKMQFRTNLGEVVDLAGLEDICDTYDLRVCMDFIQKGAQNFTRGLVGRSPADGRVYVFDTASRTRYRPADLDVRGKVEALGVRLTQPVADGGGGSNRLEQLAAAVPVEKRIFSTAETVAARRGKVSVQLFSGRMHEAANETIECLRAEHTRLFDMGGLSVVVDDDHKVRQARGNRLAHEMQRVIDFSEVKVNAKGGVREVEVDPPKDLVGRVESLSHLLPALRAAIDMPVMTRNGRVLREGYDTATSLLVLGGGEVAEVVPEEVGDEAARLALDVLWQPFSEFPFASAMDKGGALAAVLTAVLRAVLPTAPMFVFDAPTQGSGKTLLSLAVGELCGGAQLTAPLPAKDEAEVRKVLLSVLLEAPRAVIFDNQWGMLDSAVLAGMLTSEVFGGRLLGTNTTLKAPTSVVVMVTGNNVLLGGETPRRAVRVRIDAGMDAPFTRRFDFCPQAYVREHRGGMVAAALILVRWALSRAQRGRIGSFEVWDEMVAQTVAGVGDVLDSSFGDPAEAIQVAHADDPRRDELGDILRSFRDEFGNKWFTGAEVSARLTGSSTNPIMDALGVDKVPSSKTVGRLLTYRRDAVVDGLRLHIGRDPKTKVNRFRVWSDEDSEQVVVDGELEHRRAEQKAKLKAIQT